MIYLWWIGEGEEDGELTRIVRTRLVAEFDEPVLNWRSPDRPAGTFDARRRQHSSRDVLRWLAAMRPAQATRIMGLTDVDLFMPVLTFVFGEAQLNGPAAVVSLARLSDRSASRTIDRAAKECLHELGHTYGLTHCDDEACVMRRSPGVLAIDEKGSTLCPACRARSRRAFESDAHV